MSAESVQFYGDKVAEVASKANELDFLENEQSFADGQYDETSVSKRKYNKGKRSRLAAEYIQTAVSVSSKKATKVFGKFVADKSSATLLPMVEHLAAVGGVVKTDGWPSYAALGSDVRVDVSHAVVNHKDTFVSADGTHTNNVEAMHSVLKRQMRRRYWQVRSRGDEGESQNKLQLVLFLENLNLALDKKDPVVHWFSCYRQQTST